MKAQLSTDEHRQLSTHLRAIYRHFDAMVKIMNGKVLVKTLDQVSAFGAIDKQLHKLRDKLSCTAIRAYGTDANKIYFGQDVVSCQTTATPSETVASHAAAK